jgi:hypothetical protein
VAVGPPKTAASRRTIALDRHTVHALRTHRRRQRAEQRAAGERWLDTGYVFTTTEGQPLHPDFLTRGSPASYKTPTYHRYGCTTCGTARRAWRTVPGLT